MLASQCNSGPSSTTATGALMQSIEPAQSLRCKPQGYTPLIQTPAALFVARILPQTLYTQIPDIGPRVSIIIAPVYEVQQLTSRVSNIVYKRRSTEESVFA